VFAKALAAGKVEEADRDSEVHKALMNKATFFSPKFLIDEGMPMQPCGPTKPSHCLSHFIYGVLLWIA